MHPKPSPDPRSSMWAWIAHDLRFYRAQRNLSGADLAKILNCARSSVSRLETGQAQLDEKQAENVDLAWKTGGHFGRLLWYARLGHDPNWSRQHLDIEGRSDVIWAFEAQVVPGLLQIPEYAHALLTAGGAPNVDALVEERMSRQAILDRESPPQLWIILSQNVIDWPVGGPSVMRRQLARLLEASELLNIGIRVLPRSAGAHAGVDGSFKIMEGGHGRVAYTESPGIGRLVTSVTEVRSYVLRYDRIGQQALPEIPSRGLIKQAMEALDD
jgi:DNA-binding XRE family transcriptional regulator